MRCKRCLFGCCSAFYELDPKWEKENMPVRWIKIKIKKNYLQICPFLGFSFGKSYCVIYRQRPKICREYYCNGEFSDYPPLDE